MRNTVLAGLIGLIAAIPALGQDRAATLADLRAQLSALAAELQSLRSELIAGGQSAIQAAGGASALDRMNAMEGQLARLTAEVEQLNNRVARIVADATNRIGDLEFRICELEDGCDPSNLPITASLGGGGGAPAAMPPAVAPGAASQGSTGAGPELAVAEKEDFERAQAALEAGDYQAAADQFARFVEAYPGGPLTSEAHFLRGEALQKLGDTANAARAYLNAFSGAPDGPRAPAALLKLGAALGVLGQVQEACVTLGEVGTRFPTSPEAVEAGTAMRALNCP
ncbi:tol-pal system protein YbgF [Albidovulum inexpectatum]|uniref:tol-pal system protein YbgF n=1 Tax=Albidovulum inexpectatum TaxID=196587 RepID=UPI001B80D0AA|nr:tol-pal system protein YbgF [Albidovulum inexpectatum]